MKLLDTAGTHHDDSNFQSISVCAVNQPGVLIWIFEWERGMIEVNNLLGKFHLAEIMPAPGLPQVEVIH